VQAIGFILSVQNSSTVKWQIFLLLQMVSRLRMMEVWVAYRSDI
jgi:hypothetical protein